jgi:hypothetical protein
VAEPFMVGSMDHKPNPHLDRIAAALASSAGVVWERLDHYPGYLRGVWRDEAALLIGAMDREPRRPA